MAHDQNSNEKVVYVGDSRVKKRTKALVPTDYSAFPGKSEAFVPNFLLKEWMVGVVVMVGYMALVLAHPAPLGYPADPNNTNFIPMPDWYFLFIYQLLKYPYLAGDYALFGTIVIPGLAFGALLLAPFLDTGKERRFYRRPVASGLMLLTLAAIFYLTNVSWTYYQKELETKGIIPEHIERAQKIAAGEEIPKRSTGGDSESNAIAIVDQDSEGYQIYQQSTCMSCHATDMNGYDGINPVLRGIGDKYSKDELVDIMKNGTGRMAAGEWDKSINNNGLTEEDMEKLADWLAIQKADAAS